MQTHDVPERQQRHQQDYQAFILRCWVEPQNGTAIWRFSLEAISKQTRHGFADLSALLQFLEHTFLEQMVLEQINVDDE